MKISGIYKITNPEGKIYIGKTNNINRRFEEYKKIKCTSQHVLIESLRKYGWFHHVFEIVEECDESVLNKKEKYWIEFFNCVNNGLNSRGQGIYSKKNQSKYHSSEYFKQYKSDQMKQLWSEGKHLGRGKKPIINLQTNKQYNSIKETCIDMKISFTKAYKYLGEGKILSYININYE